MTLHIVKLDVLLWAFGGFAEFDSNMPFRSNGLTPEYVRGLKAIAAKPRADHGEVKTYARRHGRNVQSASSYISRFRNTNKKFPYHIWADLT